MMKNSNFYKKVENQGGNFLWSGVEVEELAATKIRLGDDDEVYDFHEDIENFVLKRTLLKDLDGDDVITSKIMLETPKYCQYYHHPST